MRPPQQNDVFHAIAHPARRTILVMLKAGERPASELAEPFGMSFAAVSQHLKILKEADLVTERRDGRQRIYHLRPSLGASGTSRRALLPWNPFPVSSRIPSAPGAAGTSRSIRCARRTAGRSGCPGPRRG